MTDIFEIDTDVKNLVGRGLGEDGSETATTGMGLRGVFLPDLEPEVLPYAADDLTYCCAVPFDLVNVRTESCTWRI